ncbi:MAG TPA: hypothetical protein VK508_09835 [Cyclobacteriaceae bacterium]|nr:hypothetical protein [Cyclobacteriaceae bacterium]
MKLESFGAARALDPEFYDKYYTPDGKPRWDVIIANLEPETPEQHERRMDFIRRLEEKERREREKRENDGTAGSAGKPT